MLCLHGKWHLPEWEIFHCFLWWIFAISKYLFWDEIEKTLLQCLNSEFFQQKLCNFWQILQEDNTELDTAHFKLKWKFEIFVGKVKQPQPARHPLEASYDLVVDEPHPSLC